jgi:4-amino-4-deoxy-L-arabinose transferase-like glycosyltransferase
MAETETETDSIAPVGHEAGLRSSGRILGFLGRHPLPFLTLLCLLLWLPGIVSLPALDRDESRFAQASRQMLESGNFVDIRLGQAPRYKKPVGIYWLQAATTAAASPFAGTGKIWTYRLASLLGGILAAWLTLWCARAVVGPEAAFLAAALMAGTLLLTAEATIATTDAVLLACTTAMQGVILRVYLSARAGVGGPSTGQVLAGWTALALGILVKGPVAPALAAVTLVPLCLWDRQARWLGNFRPLLGLLVLLVIVLPWLLAIAMASHGAFFEQSLGNDFAAKIAGGQESHGAPPGYFLVLSALTLWPAVLFVAPGIAAAVPRHREPAIRFLLVWAAGWWLLVEIVPTKLPHYVISAYPALAILAADGIMRLRLRRGLWDRIGAWIASVQFLIGAVGLVAALAVLPHLYGPGDLWWLWVVAGCGGLLALAALGMFAAGRRPGAAMLALGAALVLLPGLSAGAGPRLDRIWMTTRLAAQARQDMRPGDPPPVLAGYQEPSMLFALGADLGLSDGAGAAEMAARDGSLALVEAREKGAFLARLAEKEANATPLQTVTGFNYSRGRPVAVTIYRVEAIGH